MAYKNEQNIRTMIAFFRAQGYPDNFIAGMIGNIATESANTFDPKQVQLSYLKKASYGIASNDDYVQRVDADVWRDPVGNNFDGDRIGFGLTQLTSSGRKTGYHNYVIKKGVSVGDLTAQLEWIVIEIGSTGYANVRKAIKENWSIEECARVICTDFERPAKKSDPNVQQNRINHALQIYEDFLKEDKPMGKIRIMLDAGHDNNRNQSPVFPAYNEATMAWHLQNYLKAELEAKGIEVGVTRSSQSEKMDVVPRGKKAKGYDLFISLHSNACSSESVDHVSGIYLVGSGTIEDRSKEIADRLCKCVTQVMGVKQNYKIYSKLNPTDRDGDGKINDDYYGVLYGSHQVGTAGIILEHSFHTNLNASKWLYADDNIKKLAVAEANILADYYGLNSDQNAPQKSIEVSSDPDPVITTALDPKEEICIYTVAKGDTVSKIASRFGMSVSEYKALNPQIANINKISVGDKHKVIAHEVIAGDTLSKIALNLGWGKLGYKELGVINGIKFPWIILKGQLLRIRK